MNLRYFAILASWMIWPIAASASPTPEEAIASVEAELLPTWWIAGEEPQATTLNQRMFAHQTPALTVAVVHDGRIDWAHAWGMANMAERVEATPRTLFQAASISKLFAAMTALSLAEAGEVSLDGNVNAQLQRWQLPASEFERHSHVSVRRILNHSAGLSVWGFDGYAPDAKIPDPVALLDGAGNSEAIRLFQQPGQGWRYSGGGYQILQILLEDVSGLPFAELAQERVLDPLLMSDSRFDQPLADDRRAQAAVGYHNLMQPVAGGAHLYPELAAAGLWTTPSDLARYVIAVQQIHAGKRSGPLSRSWVQAMLTPGDGDHGLGPRLSEDRSRFHHGGSNAGFRCYLYGTLDGSHGAVLMSNGDGGGKLYAEVLQALAKIYGWEGFEPEIKTTVSMSSEQLAAFAGQYQLPDIGTLTLRPGEGELVATSTFFAGETRLLPEAPTRFFDRGNRESFAFELSEGRAIAVTVAGRLRAARVGD